MGGWKAGLKDKCIVGFFLKATVFIQPDHK